MASVALLATKPARKRAGKGIIGLDLFFVPHEDVIIGYNDRTHT